MLDERLNKDISIGAAEVFVVVWLEVSSLPVNVVHKL